MPGTIWERFDHDPRRPENAPLRASDRERDLVQDLLGTAYAEGRLTREELDERTERVAGAKTLGELPPLVSDLVATALGSRLPMSTSDRHTAAELRYRRVRQQAVTRFLTASLISWAIWAATMLGGFAWPVFVMVVTGVRCVQLLTNHSDTVAAIERDMEKRERRRLRQRDRRDPWANPG